MMSATRPASGTRNSNSTLAPRCFAYCSLSQVDNMRLAQSWGLSCSALGVPAPHDPDGALRELAELAQHG